MDLKQIQKQTTEIYESQAYAWDQQRPKVFFERDWMDRFLSCLPQKADVLEVGCGASDPIGKYLLDQGIKLTGIDASKTMIEISSNRYPEADWYVMDMRQLSFSKRFDGIIGWDSFFHLNQDEQRKTLNDFCNHLKPGGALLLTIGDEAGEVTGIVNGHQVYHSSLATEEYQSILSDAGFAEVTIKLVDKDCADHSILLASNFSPKKTIKRQ